MNKFAVMIKKITGISTVTLNCLAVCVNYDSSYISKWVTGKSLPSKHRIQNICKNISGLIIKTLNPAQKSELCKYLGFDSDDVFEIQEELRRQLLKAYFDSGAADEPNEKQSEIHLELLPDQLNNRISIIFSEFNKISRNIQVISASDPYSMADKTSYYNVLKTSSQQITEQVQSCMFTVPYL